MDATPKYVAKAVELSYHEMKYYIDFAVIADVSPRIVLGMDFINKAGVIIDSYRKTIILSAPTIHSEPIPKTENTTQKKVRFDSTTKPKSILKPEKERITSNGLFCYRLTTEKPLRIRLTEPIDINPGEAKGVNYRLYKGIESLDKNYVIEVTNHFKTKGLALTEGVVNPKPEEQSILLINRGLEPVHLDTKDTIGTAEELDIVPIPLRVSETTDQTIPQDIHKQIMRNNSEKSLKSFRLLWNAIYRKKKKLLSPNEQYFTENTNSEYLKPFDISDDLTPKERYVLFRMLKAHRNQFAFEGDPLGRVDIIEHKIELLPGAKPVKCKLRFRSPVERQKVEECINKMLARGIIRPVSSEWCSPLIVIIKRDQSLRIVTDFRAVNQISKSDSFPMPDIEESLSLMAGNDRFSVMDFESCFYQIPLAKESQHITTFISHLGTFCYNLLPLGLSGSPKSCARTMAIVLRQRKPPTIVHIHGRFDLLQQISPRTPKKT